MARFRSFWSCKKSLLVAEVARIRWGATNVFKRSKLPWRHHESQRIAAIRRESFWIRYNSFLFVTIRWTSFCVVVILSRSYRFFVVCCESGSHLLDSFWFVLYSVNNAISYIVVCRRSSLCFVLHRESSTWFAAKSTLFCRKCIRINLFLKLIRPNEAIFSVIICGEIRRGKIVVICWDSLHESWQWYLVFNNPTSQLYLTYSSYPEKQMDVHAMIILL